MKLAIVGYGKMGKIIHQIAQDRNIEVAAIISPNCPEATHKELNEDSLKGIDVAIDFTIPAVAMQHIRIYAENNTNVVFGTTGWYNEMKEVESIIHESESGFIWSGNFSIGVNLFFTIVKQACQIMDGIDGYDPFAYELHHNQKKDSPSGTAEMIGNIMIDNLSSKDTIVTDKLDRQIESNELHLASVRGGNIPGTHVVGFDSRADTIELKHTARNRHGFAYGAVLAAEWVADKSGFFSIEDFMNDLLSKQTK